MTMRQFCVISGGAIEDTFVCRMLEEQRPEMIIAADFGLEFLYRNRIKPQVVVGDFDSAGREAFDFFQGQPDIKIQRLNPIKDDTDTESAVRLAITMGAEAITLFGATGSRLDHVLGNIELLGIGLEAGVPITLMDAHNRIRMLKEGIVLKKEEQFGTYVSLIPYTEHVEHLYLRGMKYPLSDHCLKGFCSLGISNEIIEEEAAIEFDGGILLLIESRD